MAEPNPDRIVVACPCGAKLRVAAMSVGKKAKCPKCGEVFKITAPGATKPSAPTIAPSAPTVAPSAPTVAPSAPTATPSAPTPQASAPAAPAPLPFDDGDDLLDELAAQEQSAAATPTGRPCPKCQALMAPGDALCMNCGFDVKKGKARATTLLTDADTAGGKAKAAAKLAGTFALGCTLSGVGAVVGAGIWCLVAVLTGLSIGYIAIGVGILAGFGMAWGYRDKSPAAGTVAACMALFGVLLGKALVFFFVIYAMLSGNTSDPELRRLHVGFIVMQEILWDQGIDPETATKEQKMAAGKEAERRVKAMSDDEINQRWEESQRFQEEYLAMEEAEEEFPGETDDAAPAADGLPPELTNPPTAEADSGLADTLRFFVQSSFHFLDLLFFFLAVSAAYKIASGVYDTD